MVKYYHAHRVIADKCGGHMVCMRCCPTQAIRIRDGKAVISEELCVDCGECLAACPSGAITVSSDTADERSGFKYKAVVPSPVLYSQFEASIHPYLIHMAFKELGFDEVADLSTSSTALARVLNKYMAKYTGRLPLISSYCPCIVRLIQVRYPDLVELLVPIDVPREVTAREVKRRAQANLGLSESEIAVVYIATCPSKIVSIRQPAEKARSWFDGVMSVDQVYPVLLPHVIALKEQFDINEVPDDFSFHPGWAILGSITRAAETEDWLAVSGLDHVKRILDDIENSRLRNVEFIELMAHMEGCLGGPFNVENPYVARANTIKQSQKYVRPVAIDDEDIDQKMSEGFYMLESPILPRPTTYFDTDLATSIKRMKERERVYQKLRQIDCGCCGAPTCMAFAEDFVHGDTKLSECIFLGLADEKVPEETQVRNKNNNLDNIS